MNKKMVKKLIDKKHDDFLKSIDDAEVRNIIDKRSVITGGSIVSLLLNENVSDFDYYFVDKEACQKVAEYYVKKFNETNKNKEFKSSTDRHDLMVNVEENRVKIVVPSAGITSESSNEDSHQYFESQPDEAGEEYTNQAFESIVSNADDVDSKAIDDMLPKYRPVFLSSNAITLSDKVQLVIRFHGDPEEIHKNYDFAHCTNYWRSSDRKLILKQLALESILTKTLYYQGSLYPVCSIIRCRKFIKRGWNINAGQMLKMMFQISELNLSDINTLEEQLTGVDAAYFHQVIDYCKIKQMENLEFRITSPYLISIIDKIFS